MASPTIASSRAGRAGQQQHAPLGSTDPAGEQVERRALGQQDAAGGRERDDQPDREQPAAEGLQPGQAIDLGGGALGDGTHAGKSRRWAAGPDLPAGARR